MAFFGLIPDSAEDLTTGKGLFNGFGGWLLGGGLLAGLVMGGLSIYGKKTGKQIDSLSDAYDLLPEGLRNFLDKIGTFFKELWEGLTGWFRSKAVPEEITAQNDVNSRLGKAYDDLDKFLGLTGATEHVRTMSQDASKKFFGISISTKPEDVLASAEQLRVDVSNYLLDELKKKYPTKDLNILKEAATNAAEYISGTKEGNTDAALITTGYGKMMLNIQAAVKEKGDYSSGSLPSTELNTTALGRAKGVLGI